MREPNFENLLKVLRREKPDRPTLFEFPLNNPLNERLVGENLPEKSDPLYEWRLRIRGYHAAGYDYAILWGSSFTFPLADQLHASSVSQNDGALIHDRASYEAYPWPDPDAFDYSRLDTLADELPDGMKLIVFGPRGVLENTLQIVGYENLCMMVIDDPDLTEEIFRQVGSRLNRYYQLCLQHDTVGAALGNDDWGFNTQTVFRPEDMRRLVIPWHREIVKTIHDAGRPAIMHSCGQLQKVMDDIIDDIGYDGKHSYQDTIQPVEDAYEQYHQRIAILGGIDVDFLCRSDPDTIKKRSREMLERTSTRGGYALGSGNSIPEYVPQDNYLAMISCVWEF